ncbi:hypothetical protein V6N13_128107 [Hibiscus sabdariffa]
MSKLTTTVMPTANYPRLISPPLQGFNSPFFCGGERFLIVFGFRESIMTRGNQRDRDRERAQARAGNKGKTKDDGLTPEQRRERDAKALQEKAAKKAAQAATGGNNAGGGNKTKK